MFLGHSTVTVYWQHMNTIYRLLDLSDVKDTWTQVKWDNGYDWGSGITVQHYLVFILVATVCVWVHR